MRVLLCSAAIAVAIGIAGCGSDSDSSSGKNDTQTASSTTSQRPQRTLHYITREAKPRNPGPHPGARVDHLIVRDIRRGQGPAIQAGDSGSFDFISSDWVTGDPVDSSWRRNSPFETQIEKNVVIDGWWQGIPGMRVGGRRQIIVPPALGFTTNPLLQSSTIFFDVVLIEIRPQRPSGLGGGQPGGAPPQITTTPAQ